MKRINHIRAKIKAKNTLETSRLQITDLRTNKQYSLPVYNNQFVNAKDLLKIKDQDGKFLRSYDPGYKNTMNCTSSITFIDGMKGILQYRGIPIE